MAANLQLLISAVDRASPTLDKINKSGAGLGKTMGTVLKVGAIAGAAGIGVAVVAGLKFAQMAAKEEVGIKRLGAAIDANGGSWAAQGKEVEKIIRQRERLAFADDELRDSLSILVAQTGNLDEALKRQTVAMDFSRGANIDLNTASKLLGKVTDENVNVLARYGIKVKEGSSATELLAEVQRRFAGQSEAFADTSVGKWQRFNNTLDNIKEAIGAGLLPVMTGATDLLVRFADAALPKVEIVVEKINEKVSALAATIIPPLKEQINNLADTVIPLLEGALAAFVGTLETIAQSQEFQAFLDGVEEGLDDLMLVATTAKQIVTDAFDTIGDQFKVAGDKAATAGGKVKITDAQYKELGTTLVQAAAGTATMGAALSLLPQLTIAQGLAIAALFSALVILETRTKVFSRVVGPAFRNAFSWLTAHKDETISALAGIAAMITAVMIPAVVAWTVAEYAKATALLVAGAAFLVANAPLVAIVAGIGLLVAALVYLELKTGFASKSFLFLKDVISAIPGTVTELVNTFTTQFPAIVQIVETVFAVIQNYFMFYIDLYTNLFKIGMALIHGDFGAAWDAIKALFSDSLGHILTHLELVLDLILTVAKEVMPLVKDAIVSALQAGLDFAKSLPGSFAAAGRDIVRGLWEGIQSLAGWLLDKAFAFGKKIYEAVKDGLGKLWPFSPSEAGVDIGKGLGLGILEGTRRILPALQRGMGALTTDLIAPMAPTPSRLSPVTQTASAASTTVAGGGMSIDYDRLASALVRALTGVRVDMDGRAVGEVVTPFVSAIQGRQADLYGRAG